MPGGNGAPGVWIKYPANEVVVVFAAVLALHAALALWLMRAQTVRVVPLATPRTIVARLLTTPPSIVATAPQRAIVPARTPAIAPAHSQPQPRPQPRQLPKANRNNTALPQPAQHIETTPQREANVAPPPSTAPTTSQPATPPIAQPASPPQEIRTPKPVSHIDCSITQPDYPEAARRRGETGTALVRFVVDTEGHIQHAQLKRSSGSPRLDEAALGALQGSTCHPYLEAGVPIPVTFEQPFTFGLEN
ncbi:MAG: energy transducer TonB [Paraburkholderia sp.]|uniref:energy transducer TonB n=1 Tax=Paraburkholderia sp. TaxID=1926495 RepID=UPI00122699EE|nr:energy transducer TonB [Paraburkholderia sp.]TAM05261.1 MAG: energy transducer TonB [Paraburkholderia sp.]TAM28713.1 MAG: energy transducer TonB [Paraburkholderia sp.]